MNASCRQLAVAGTVNSTLNATMRIPAQIRHMRCRIVRLHQQCEVRVTTTTHARKTTVVRRGRAQGHPGACDDGLFCNGVERCEGLECLPGTSPCAQDETCDEDVDACIATCSEDAHCNDWQSMYRRQVR